MKAWPLILACFILSLVIYLGDFSFKVTRHLEFSGFRFDYNYTCLTSDRFRICENAGEEYSARLKLMKCLCAKYSLDKNTAIKNYVLDFYNNYNEPQQIYAREIVFKTDSNIIYQNREKIFRDDERILKAIRKYKDNDTSKLKLILFHSLADSYNSRSHYDEIIDTMHYSPPTIDSIVKYKDLLFRDMGWGCGCE